MTATIDKVIAQLGELRFSRSHYKEYKTYKPTLDKLLKMIHTNAIFNLRAEANITGFTDGCFTIDFDGDEAHLSRLLITLEVEDISYIAFPSPSRLKNIDTHYKTRVVIPITGHYDKETYKLQYTETILRLGLKIDGVDLAVTDSARFFYPPQMIGISEPKDQKPKPRDYTVKTATAEVECFYGNPLPLPTTFSDEALTLNLKKRDKDGVIQHTGRTPIYVDDDTMLYSKGEPIGAFNKVYEEFMNGERDDRCDCPFPNAHHHGNGNGYDYGILCNGGVVCKGGNPESDFMHSDRVTYNHGTVILQMLSTQKISLDDFEVL